MKIKAFLTVAALAGYVMTVTIVWAQQQPDPELLKAKEFFGTAGIPGDKWIEGETMVPHVSPATHFKSAMLYYPGTEELQPDEVRIIFMGSTLARADLPELRAPLGERVEHTLSAVQALGARGRHRDTADRALASRCRGAWRVASPAGAPDRPHDDLCRRLRG